MYNEEHPDAALTLESLHASKDEWLVANPGVLAGLPMHLLVSSGFSGGNMEQAMNAANRARLAQIFDTTIGFVPSPPGKITGFLYDQSKSWTSGEISAPPEDKATLWASETDQSITGSLERGFYQALLDHGYLNPEIDPKYGLPLEATTIVGGRRQLLPGLNGGEGEVDPKIREIYANWHSLNPAHHLVEPWYITPYKTKFELKYD
jgi:hypothetical protein